MKKKRQRRALTQEIKVSGIHFDQIADGIRSFVLIVDDRTQGSQVGDLLIIQKWNMGKKDGEPILRTIKGIQKTGKGLMNGYIILGLSDQEK